jgi:hypothetical protein
VTRFFAFRFLLSPLVAGTLLAQPVRRQRDNANALIATIPIARDVGSTILIATRLNGGKSSWWALDTGASECIVDRSAVKNARLATRGSRELHGAGKGTVRLDSIRSRVNLQLAGQSLPTCEHFGSVDLSTATGVGGSKIAGILGYEFFSHYVVRIDFGAHQIKLYDPAKYQYAGSGDTLKLEFVRKLPRVAVRIRTARRPEIVRRLIVDTGSEDAVDDESIRRSPNGPRITVSTSGLGKSYEAVIGTLDTVWIGRSMFTNVPGVASDVGIIGNGIWSRFICTFDYNNERMFVEAR